MENNGGAGPEVGRPLIKHLACSQKSIREKALKVLLKSWLPSQSQQLPEDDIKKLWKGLFYCVWHSDKPLVQADLIDRLSSLLLILDPALSLQYFSTFFITMRREWSGIDALRLDKFYLLIRRFISKFFSLLKKNSWNLELVQKFMSLLDEATFSAEDNLKGNGVNYHVATVFVEELTPFLPVKEDVLEVFFKPFFAAMGKLPDKVLLLKIKSGVFDVLVRNGKMLLEIKKKGEGDVDVNGDVLNLGTVALVMGFSSRCFELGSAPNCLQGNRKVLFELHREFLKLEKDVGTSGFKFSIPDSVDMDDEEVPNSVPIDNNAAVEVDTVVNADVAAKLKKLKKCKKDKKDSVDKENKKAKKKKNKSDLTDLNCETSPVVNDSKKIASENGENSNNEQVNDESTVLLNENVMSNLQKQFEKIAAEAGMDDGVASVFDVPKGATTGAVSKKRKRTKNLKGKTSQDVDLNGGDADDTGVGKSGEKSAKKVRFSMKNNLVWKPHSPLPPQDLRLPPSATPRGSALKKGVPPGPIREMPLQTKKPRQKKKNRKAIIGVFPAGKHVKKLKTWTV